MITLQTSTIFLAVLGCVTAKPLHARAAPTVTLDSATVTGVTSGSTNQFLGIPFAQPPYVDRCHTHPIFTPQNRTGNLRFQLPQTLPPYNASFSATAYGPACPQQAIALPLPSGLPAETIDYVTNSIYNVVTPSAEDCAYENV